MIVSVELDESVFSTIVSVISYDFALVIYAKDIS